MMQSVVSAGLRSFLAEQQKRTDALLLALAQSSSNSLVGRALSYALQGGGKRLRPALCVASYRAVGGRNEAIQRLAASLEILHTYSLVHDDLPCMDNDDVRRGRETTHRVFGDRAAMLAGAALIPLAFRCAHEAMQELTDDDDLRSRVVALIAQSAGAAGMVGGQVLDLQAAAQITDTHQLERIHAAKTGALITAACVAGALAAAAAPAQLHAIEAYARHLGLAFQITDDVLDETASSAELGKTAGKDRDRAKATYPALLGLQGARTRAREEVEAAMASLSDVALNDAILHELAAFAIERRR